MGRQFDREHAIWARDLTPREKSIYLRLKSLGYSDKNIYNQLNRVIEEKACAGG
jgi:DNA-binding NarL/FixJ family response regulator